MYTPHRPLHAAFRLIAVATVATILCTNCRKPATPPERFVETEERPLTYPDYTDITCPYNIAPLNFKVMNPGQECIAELTGRHGTLTASSGRDGALRFPAPEWHSVMESHKGDSLTVRLYVKDRSGWRRLRPYKLQVAAEPIDRFLTYRLIEPGYIAFKQMGIYQRDLTGFDVRTLYETPEKHCVNCHNYQGHGTGRMMLHVRGNNAGTLICDGKDIAKLKFPEQIPHGATYPAWHPERRWLVFSSNSTNQSFHINHPEKIEVQDMASDLIFYNHDTRTARYILRTDSVLETFPHWAPDGRRLYFTAAHVPDAARLTEEERTAYFLSHYKELRYDIMYMDFDTSTQTFGQPRTLVNCSKEGKSASVARVSPDGRYLLYTLADYGQFHIWHRSADLWICNLQDSVPDPRPLAEANSKEADSYHSWSSNGRWIVFSSRRDDGSYTRPYFAYFNRKGHACKPFMLPVENPDDHILLLKSYNVPELTRDAAIFDKKTMEQAVTGLAPETVGFEATHVLYSAPCQEHH